MVAGTVLTFLKGLAKPAKVAAIVGTALCLVNGTFASEDLFKAVLNYVVPFLVSAYSRFSFQRELSRAGTAPLSTVTRANEDNGYDAPEIGPASGAATACGRERESRGFPNDRR